MATTGARAILQKSVIADIVADQGHSFVNERRQQQTRVARVRARMGFHEYALKIDVVLAKFALHGNLLEFGAQGRLLRTRHDRPAWGYRDESSLWS